MVRKVASAVMFGVLAGVFALQPAAQAGGSTAPARVVVGGQAAPAGRFPWMVRLSMGCGGVLTAPRVVLTAGHCVSGTGPDDTIRVTAGSIDLRSGAAVKARSVAVIRAAGFLHETRGDDWALVKLDRELPLPVLGLTRGGTDERGPLTIIGWGQTREDSLRQETRLRYGTVPVIGDEGCARAYRTVNVKLVRKEAICAGGSGTDACQGDSGGPLVHQTADHRFVQVGIVSFGLGCARRAYPGVYTQISRFQADIRRATRVLS